MGFQYQTGTIGPIAYFQNNSEVATDTDTPVNYRPEQFGAPPGAVIITGTVQISQKVDRGLAYVHNLDVVPEGISFMVYTQAADTSWPWGHQSGAIHVTTTFQWYYIANAENALEGGEAFPMQEAPAVLPNVA